MAETLKKRSEQNIKDTWNVEDIYKTVGDWEKDLAIVGEIEKELAGYKGRICENGKATCEFLDKQEELFAIIEKVYSYAARVNDQDTKVAESQALMARARATYAGIASTLSFVTPEFLKISDEELQKLYEEEPKLHKHDVEIKDTMRRKEHVLSEAEEKIIALSSQVMGGAGEVFGMFNNADVKFPEILDENGEKVRVSHGKYISLLESKDARVRKDAFEAYYRIFMDSKNMLAANYNNLIQSHIFRAKAKKFDSCLEAAVFGNDVPSNVYKNLVETVGKNVDKLHRYMGIRKKALGFDEQHMYDLFVPLVKDVDKKIPYEEGKQIVLDALKPMGEDYCKVIKEAFDNRWIDVYENEGKRSGAYSAGVYGVHPYVLLNYSDTLDSVFTLAHELGHAMHSYMSSHAQSCNDANYVIFVAEVASICNEALLTQALLKKTTDKKERAYIVNHMLDNFRTTFYRQTMFAEFEMGTHEKLERGESLTADALSSYYYELNKKYYGDNVVSDPEIAYEWSRIPHFYYNFYVYQYATGFAAALALSNRILTEGETAVKDYMKFLSGGCTLPPTELLKIAGVDMTTPKPLEDALKVFDEMMDEMEALI